MSDAEDTSVDVPEEQCQCTFPADNDQGVCMNCGRWIGYRNLE